MKLLSHLEKNKTFWSLVSLCILFFLLRLPSIIEPYWYGDEGIYHVLGLALNQGQVLYRDIWDNKPPLLYVIYALANSDQMTVRFISLIIGLLSVLAFFLLAIKLFTSNRITLIITTIYVLLFATPILEGNIANAENFILFPIILAALLIYSHVQKSPIVIPAKAGIQKTDRSRIKSGMTILFSAGLLLGIAFLFKIVAIFDLVAFALFIVMLALPKITRRDTSQAFIAVAPLLAGFVLPFILSLFYFATQNILG
ncbi:MAG: phospholipid carrier-dependent glycosyltransferase, partial [Candidatus Levybacteria bacterium]|nr:phospholipid carrier-dependent glycosyltransferase [Candidatus Levybacteria bacterium]